MGKPPILSFLHAPTPAELASESTIARSVIGIVIDGLMGNQQFGCRRKALAATGVAGVARMCPAGDLQAQAVAAPEAVGRGPEIDGEWQRVIGCGSRLIWLHTQQTITDVQRGAPPIDIAQTHEK